MTPNAWIALAGVLGSWFISWTVAQSNAHREALANAEWRGKTGAQIDTLYRIIFRTGTKEGVDSGVLSQNSPITVNVEAFGQHPDLLMKLRKFYEAEGSKLSDLELMIEIEKRFPADLQAFESQHNLTPAATLAAACYLLRPEMKLFERRKAMRF